MIDQSIDFVHVVFENTKVNPQGTRPACELRFFRCVDGIASTDAESISNGDVATTDLIQPVS
jgi:hypothetical protein